MPSFFVAHGAPTLALEEDDFTRAARAFGAKALSGARAVAIVSAHWEARPPMRVNAVARPQPIYDFGGFDPALYRVRYDAPGDPEVARTIAATLAAAGIESTLETARGWDHGVWVPLKHLLPEARIPVVEVSLPQPVDPKELLRAGRALAPLRDDGIAIAGSGGIVHNLGLLNFANKNSPPADWAVEFDTWVAEKIAERDFDAIADWRRAAHAGLAVPTPEHFEPLLIALGASTPEDRLTEIYAGFQYATLSMRSVAFG
jgi:4,5-DOPA dioxygenase extradiol